VVRVVRVVVALPAMGPTKIAIAGGKTSLTTRRPTSGPDTLNTGGQWMPAVNSWANHRLGPADSPT